MFITKQISSLQRVFLDGKCNLGEIAEASALRGERFSYQIAYTSDERFFADIVVESALSGFIEIRSVGNVPSEYPCGADEYGVYERTEAGLFPDVLEPIDGQLLIKRNNCYSVWLTAELPKELKSGLYPITVKFCRDGEALSENTLMLRVINAVLPEQTLTYTQWFHCDGIANYYNTPVFSDRFWELTESFMKAAVRTGVNMILTPVFTPPLDTQIGGERLTVQLVDVKESGGKYTIAFDNFVKWVRLAEKCGFKYFEISHLFSQWGAVAAPKIIAETDGEEKRIFGWDTVASSQEYADFLRAFLPNLIKVIKREGIEKSTFFHVSDEPNEEQIGSYSAAKAIISPLLEGFPIIDALSDYVFYEKGIVSRPIPCTNEIESFIDKGFEHPWTYYCCGQTGKLSNRFFGMPLAATRAIGVQLFKYNIEGFLQWGFNFYNSQYSTRSIDPYRVTDADGAFPSGDSFTVYPGKNGAIESVRSAVFYDGLQDMRAMQLLAERIGTPAVVELLENEFGKITFTEYPRGAEKILKIRKIINNHLDSLYKL